MPRMPSDSFERFMALGSSRSYALLAKALGVSKRSVTARAAKEQWQARLASVESEARARTDQRLVETAAAINDRHLRTLRAIQAKALQALTTAPTGTAAQASATLIAAVRAERAIVSPPETQGPGVVWREILAEVSRRAPPQCRESPPAVPAPLPAAPAAVGET